MFRSSWLVLAACGNSAGQPDPGPAIPDGAPMADVAVAEECVALGVCDWLEDYQRAIVGTLSGAADITPGVRLDHRASVAERSLARQYLLDELATLDIPTTLHSYATGANVIATLPSTTGSGGTIIVGAHFDGVPAGPGAADNATGVAIVMATARYLRALPTRNRTVVFALFDEEELGLIGSKAYAGSLSAAGTELEAVHIFDMLSFDGDGDRAVELWSPSASLLPLYEQHGALANMPITPVEFSRSDHQAFLDLGLPAVGIGEEFTSGDHTPHYHKATDTFDRVSFAHCGAVTHLAFSILEASVTAP